MVAMFTRQICITVWSWRLSLKRVGKFEFLNSKGYLKLFSDIVYRANFRAAFRYIANSFSRKFVILNDISREYLRGLAKNSPNYPFD